MSGGSYNYLYTKESEEWLDHLDDIKQMSKALLENYDSENRRKAAKDFQRIITYLNLAKDCLEMVDLVAPRELMKAIEWHQSRDWGKEDVENLLEDK